MTPKNFTDKADEWRSWQEEVADYVGTETPGMKKVLAEIDQKTDVIDALWRHARETKYGKVMEEHTNLWRLLLRITEGESKKVVMSIKDEDGVRAWPRLKQRFELGLAARQGIVMESPGESIALLTEMDHKMKLVEDVTGEEVSEMHARSVLVGVLDPETRQHKAMNHSKSYEALKKIVQEFANSSTTGLEAMQSGRVEAGATATTAGRNKVLSTPWVHNSGPAKDAVTCPGTLPMAKARTSSGRARAHTNGARATTTGTRAATTGCTREELLWSRQGVPEG